MQFKTSNFDRENDTIPFNSRPGFLELTLVCNVVVSTLFQTLNGGKGTHHPFQLEPGFLSLPWLVSTLFQTLIVKKRTQQQCFQLEPLVSLSELAPLQPGKARGIE